ncbi:hypothetical protein Franean1_5382 [Parafrankia sp. EAN1pec]|nr:hypothetical protein Franean1_5382 [Frankia sp. EAN1pec]
MDRYERSDRAVSGHWPSHEAKQLINVCGGTFPRGLTLQLHRLILAITLDHTATAGRVSCGLIIDGPTLAVFARSSKSSTISAPPSRSNSPVANPTHPAGDDLPYPTGGHWSG